jgi:hypothetical protein
MLIARGEKNILKWGNKFVVSSVSSSSGRVLSVLHTGKSAQLDASGNPSTEFESTPLEGIWELRTLLTESESRDITTAPEKLSINVIFNYKK